jgi:hypothetical protein
MRRDQRIVEHFLLSYNHYHRKAFRIVCWPDVVDREKEAVEAVAANELGITMALEHTLVEPFQGEREDADRFMRVFSQLEGNAELIKPGYNIDLVVKIGAIQRGVKWQQVGDAVRRHLAGRIPLLAQGWTFEEIPDVGFPLGVSVGVSAHDPGERDHVWIARSLPQDSLEVVVRRTLDRKLPKLVAQQADKHILLLEKADIARGLTDIRATLDNLSSEFPQFKLIDEVWLVITHSWDSEDTLFFYELWPELGGRRFMLENSSTSASNVKVLGAGT